MNWQQSLHNCFWLLIPLLAWNIVLGPKIAQEAILSDAHSPKWLLLAENISRILVFSMPLLLPLTFHSSFARLGWLIYLSGSLIYFASWIPLLAAPDSAWSSSTIGLLAPRLTPLLPFLGSALIGQSWLYAGISIMFISLHTIHGIHNL